ncbi:MULTISPECIES: S8 family peptidase [Shewanella]|uniref:S8 family peptidase n=2 Tax=Unclassified Bacteria TaxID=49928 RepID=A0AAU6VW91_UNCXX|nr:MULTISPECIES: S8 family peptidase [Shewanella]MBO2556875.1 S8 family peptidase [Shewanella algae]MBO2573809.1 S8 family peptidase [Shewanella algae]MBO2586783.1 S8 family peptidase [Shewanella algae]MBO2612175.1 S8 family peptidase [Shewanella algae]MBO2633031.1 S8 family peptidase [Shewanella algae]
MQRKHFIAIAVAAALSSPLVLAQDYQAQLHAVNPAKAIKDQYIVVFNTPAVINLNDPNGVSAYASSMGARLANEHGIEVRQNFGNSLNGVLVKANAAQIQSLLKDPNIKYVEQDQRVSIEPMVEAAGDQGGATWGLDRIDQRDLPLNSNYHYDYDGSGVTAFVIDTGVRNTHNEFGGRASSGYDFIDNDNDSSDCNGHGTHVAGTIGGSTYGVAKNVNIVGVRVLNCSGSGTNSGVISGINWVKNNAQGPSVANMSLGGGASQALDDAVNAAVAAGISFVVAAGNDNSNACNYSPARAANAVTVGSTTSTDSRSSFSNYGTCLDIYAPGSSITSAWYNSNSATNTISGTSMASPHVAGVAALYLAENPALSPTQLTNLLVSRASSGKVGDAKTGSPNKLLYSLAGDDGGCGNDCPSDDTPLDNGVGISVSGVQGSSNYFYIDVPAGAADLNIDLAGGSGDADLYVSQGSKPTLNSYQCRPYKSGNNESCSFSSPAEGRWYVMLQGYSAYSGATLTATHNAGGGCGSDCLENGVPKSNLSGSAGSEQHFTVQVPAGVSLNIATSGGSGDADLYVRAGAAPSTSVYDCRPYKNGNSESCSFQVTQAATYHVMIRGYSAFSGMQLLASF